MTGQIVVVTGANGFIGSWITKQLLERGYEVRGTVRDPQDLRKVKHLLELPGAPQRLTLHRADVLEDGAFDGVTHGAHFVLHTAIPGTELENIKSEEIVEGGLNILRSASRAESVKRVVITSSNVAAFVSERYSNRGDGELVDESWWSDVDFCLKQGFVYHAGKTLAEKASFEFARTAHFDLVAINPVAVIGALLQETMNFSSNVVLGMLTGVDVPSERSSPVPLFPSWVDVEDVARAHILAMEDPRAEGRYLAAAADLSYDQAAVLVAKLFPEIGTVHRPPMEGKDAEAFLKPAENFSTAKLRNLGFTFTPFEETLRKTVESLREHGGV